MGKGQDPTQNAFGGLPVQLRLPWTAACLLRTHQLMCTGDWLTATQMSSYYLYVQHLFPELGQDLQERAYGSDCRLWLPEERRVNWEVIKGTVFDEFVVAHTLGWWCALWHVMDVNSWAC